MMNKGCENNTKSAGFTSAKLYSVTIRNFMYFPHLQKYFLLQNFCKIKKKYLKEEN